MKSNDVCPIPVNLNTTTNANTNVDELHEEQLVIAHSVEISSHNGY